ncbi:MAG: hypothetical protein ABI910_17720 [Gemmatimonadota bacterium]
MARLLIWAIATGFVTGAVWFAIIFFRRGTPDIEELRRLAAEDDLAVRRALPAVITDMEVPLRERQVAPRRESVRDRNLGVGEHRTPV